MSTLIVEVCQVKDIQNIPTADRLELCIVKGWSCVVQKGRFKVGDSVVYFPIDSILPEDLMNILFGGDVKIKPSGGRIRTIKIRKALSQGLVVGLTEVGLDPKTKVGTDVKEKLGVIKYEPPTKPAKFVGKQTSKKNTNPHFHKYTDIEHLRNYPEALLGREVIVTEKIHGTNWRASYSPKVLRFFYQKVLNKLFNYYTDRYEFCYGSKNIQLQYKLLKESKHFDTMFGNNIYWEMVQKYDIMNKLKNNMTLYGEAYGNGVQANYNYGCKQGEHKLVIIDIKIGDSYIDTLLAFNLTTNMGLPFVPILYQGVFEEYTIDRIDMSKSILCPEQKVMEGIVIHTAEEQNGYMGRMVFKYLNPEYLLNKSNTDFH